MAEARVRWTGGATTTQRRSLLASFTRELHNAMAVEPRACALRACAEDRFAAWRHTHSKVYLTTATRPPRAVLPVDDALINKHNEERPTRRPQAVLRPGPQVARLAAQGLSVKLAARVAATHRASHSSLPAASRLGSAGAVSPVKDQGTCGSCWSFAATGAIEASLFVDRGVSTSLSQEEQLIDCDKGAPQDGCKGGAIEEAFRWVRRRPRNSAQFGAIL